MESKVTEDMASLHIMDIIDDTRADLPHPALPRPSAEKTIAYTFDDFLKLGDRCSLENYSYSPSSGSCAFPPEGSSVPRKTVLRKTHHSPYNIIQLARAHSSAERRRTRLWNLVLKQESLPPDGKYTKLINARSGPISPWHRAEQYVLRAPDARLRLQQIHISYHAIPATLADARVKGAAGLVAQLNDICGTYVALTPGLRAFLAAWRGWDVGSVYGWVRPWWRDFASGWLRWESIERRMRVREDEDKRLRSADNGVQLPGMLGRRPVMPARSTTHVLNMEIPPRRIWDLYSNRVLPYYTVASPVKPIPANVWAVSHSWVDAAERADVWTSVNGRQWPVSLPTDVSLEQVRIELLNMGAEYVFLDVLCLKQPGASDEDMRQHEWELDVPTLGHIYRHSLEQTVVVYFNGLGRPFDASASCLASPLHWLNRAWTLQETTVNWLPGGLTAQGCTHWDGHALSQGLRQAQQALTLAPTEYSRSKPSFANLLRAMQSRPGYADKKPYDRVAALAYLIPDCHPQLYTDSTTDAEKAWQALVETLSYRERLCLLLFDHDADDADEGIPDVNGARTGEAHGEWERRRKGRFLLWRPTWDETMRSPRGMPDDTDEFGFLERLMVAPWVIENAPRSYYHIPYLVHVYDMEIIGELAFVRTAMKVLVFKPRFRLEDLRQYTDNPENGHLVLVGTGGLKRWVLCWTLRRKFVPDKEKREIFVVTEKLGVIHVPDAHERKEMEDGAQREWVAYVDSELV